MIRWTLRAVLAVVLAGCSTPAATPSQPAGSYPSTAPPDVSPSPTSSGTPLPEATATATAAPPADLPAAWQTVRVRVNGLAVRREPSPTAPFVAAYRFGDELPVVDEVRLNDGSFLWIEDGPLVIDGVPWYRVANNQRQTDDPDGDNVLLWDADGDEQLFDYGWVAGGDGASVYFIPADSPPPPPDAPVFGGAPDPYAILSGIGSGGTDSFEPIAPVGIRWYAADPEGASCGLTITLQPVGVVMVSVEIDGWAGDDDFWPKDSATPMPSDARVEVETDCSWSLRVVPIQG